MATYVKQQLLGDDSRPYYRYAALADKSLGLFSQAASTLYSWDVGIVEELDQIQSKLDANDVLTASVIMNCKYF